MEKRPLNHVEPEATPRTLKERQSAAARLAPLPERATPRVSPSRATLSGNALTCLIRNLTSVSDYVRKEAERQLLSLPVADRQKIHEALGKARSGSAPGGMSLEVAQIRANALRLTARVDLLNEKRSAKVRKAKK